MRDVRPAAEALCEITRDVCKVRRMAHIDASHAVDPLGSQIAPGIYERRPRFAPSIRPERDNRHLDHPVVVARMQSSGLDIDDGRAV